MSKGNKIERIIYIAIIAIFLIACSFPVMHSTSGNGMVSAYRMIFTDGSLSVFGNIFLALPLVLSLTTIILNIVEISTNIINFGIELTNVIFYFMSLAFGLMFATITETNMIPYGMIVMAISLALVITRIIFHYGVRGQKI
jgi:hypothetical protein